MAPNKQPLLTALTGRLLRAAHWHQLRLVLLANAIIALFLTLIGLKFTDAFYWLEAAVSFIYSQSIGLSIYFLISVCTFIQTGHPFKRGLGLLCIFALGSLLGIVIAACLIWALFDIRLRGDLLWQMLLYSSALGVVFASVVGGYFALYEKWQQTAADLAEQQIEQERLQQLRTRAELEALRAKVSPHFLFNTLNSIASLTPIDPERAERMVQGLADLLRYTLEASDRELVLLDEELGVIRRYLEIEQIRLGTRLTYEIDVAPEVAGFALPGLLIQPLVENCVKHGIAPEPGGGSITVRCWREDHWCCVEVRDTGRGFDAEPQQRQRGFGLCGVRQRLALHYGPHYRFDLYDEGGACVAMHLPLQGRETG